MFIIEGVTPSWLLWNKWNLLLTNRIRPIKNNVKEAQINIFWPVWQTKDNNKGSETRQSATGDIPCPVGATYITITVCLCDRGKQENIDQFKQNSLITSLKKQIVIYELGVPIYSEAVPACQAKSQNKLSQFWINQIGTHHHHLVLKYWNRLTNVWERSPPYWVSVKVILRWCQSNTEVVSWKYWGGVKEILSSCPPSLLAASSARGERQIFCQRVLQTRRTAQ